MPVIDGDHVQGVSGPLLLLLQLWGKDFLSSYLFGNCPILLAIFVLRHASSLLLHLSILLLIAVPLQFPLNCTMLLLVCSLCALVALCYKLLLLGATIPCGKTDLSSAATSYEFYLLCHCFS